MGFGIVCAKLQNTGQRAAKDYHSIRGGGGGSRNTPSHFMLLKPARSTDKMISGIELTSFN